MCKTKTFSQSIIFELFRSFKDSNSYLEILPQYIIHISQKRFHSNRPHNTQNVLSPSIYSTEETLREILADEKFLTESRDRKEYNHTSIAGIAKSLMHGVVQNYTADTTRNTSGESSSACTYIKQHSLSLREIIRRWRLSHVYIACIFSCDVWSPSCKRFQRTTYSS